MDAIGTGAGLAAIGFWLFVAGAIAAGVWDKIRKRDAQHETLRRVIESGTQLDNDIVSQLLMLAGDGKTIQRDLTIGGRVLLGVAAGLAVMGWILSIALADELLPILLAVAALVACISGGLLLASRVVGDEPSKDNPL